MNGFIQVDELNTVVDMVSMLLEMSQAKKN